MRYAHSTFPWLLALTLCAVSACDDDWFRVPLCTYSPKHELCETSMGDGMGNGTPGGDPSSGSGMNHRPIAPQVSFKFAHHTGSPRKLVGIRPEGTITLASQGTGGMAKLEFYKLITSISTATGWDLNIETNICSGCPSQVSNIDLNKDYILSGNLMFIAVKNDNSGNYAYLLESDGILKNENKVSQNGLSNKFRPSISSNSDRVTLQENTTTGNATTVNYYSAKKWNSIQFPERTNIPGSTWYAVGNLESQEADTNGDEMLLFEDNALSNVYHFSSSSMPMFDRKLKEEINTLFINAAKGDTAVIKSPIDTAIIADLNNDGYMELIYSRLKKIFVATYIPWETDGNHFKDWGSNIVDVVIFSQAEALSVADLNGDNHPDMVFEGPGLVHVYVNNN